MLVLRVREGALNTAAGLITACSTSLIVAASVIVKGQFG